MDSLESRMQGLGLLEDDLVERFVLGSGSGGQKINKTSSCVYLKHVPSGVEVSCQESRSREQNREIARQRLCEHFEKVETEKRLNLARARARRRYQSRRPSPSQKRRLRESKTHRSEKKAGRRRPGE